MRAKVTHNRYPLLLAALALLHGLLYAWLVPPWQTPDEPAQFQYAALIAARGGIPKADDAPDALLEQRIVTSLTRAHFFEYLIGQAPPTPLRTMADAQALFFMPSQIGNDPPLYFWLAALPIRLLGAAPIEGQLLALRVLGALLTAGAVLCVYGAARELELGPDFALAAGLVAALQPMFMFVGMGAGNDGLANLIGAALCWALLRIVRRGISRRRAALVLALVLLGLLTKRTLLPSLLVVGLLGAGWAALWLARVPLGHVARLGAGAMLVVALLGGRVALASDHAPALAADWVDAATGQGASRAPAAPGTGRPALDLGQGTVGLQALPDITAEWIQNQELSAQARVWSAGGTAQGVLAIDFGWATVEQPFHVDARGRVVRMRAFIPLYCPYVHVELRALSGTLYADRLQATSARRPSLNVLTNGELADAALRPGSVAAQVGRLLRLREFGWVWRSGRLLEAPPLGWLLGRIFFASFWGQFGWMSLPLVGGTPWERALWLVCGGGVAGTLVWAVAPGRAAWRRRAAGLLLLLIASGVLLPLLNAYTAPRNQAIVQGRYLFPALAPIAIMLALGWRALLPPRWRPAGLAVGALFGLAFAGAALAMVARFYGSLQ